MQQFVDWQRSWAKCEPGTDQIEPLWLDWAQRQWLATSHTQQCHLRNAHCPAALQVTDASVFSRVDCEEHPGSPRGYGHVRIVARSKSKQQIVTGVSMVIGINILLNVELHCGFQVNT